MYVMYVMYIHMIMDASQSWGSQISAKLSGWIVKDNVIIN